MFFGVALIAVIAFAGMYLLWQLMYDETFRE